MFKHFAQNHNSAKALIKAVKERKPLDNTFFSVIKPKHNLATISAPLKRTWNTRKFFRGSGHFVFVLAGFPQLAPVILPGVMLSHALGSAHAYQSSHSTKTIAIVSHLKGPQKLGYSCKTTAFSPAVR